VDGSLADLMRDLKEGNHGRHWATVAAADNRYTVALEQKSPDQPYALYDFHATPAEIRKLAAAASRAGIASNPYGDTVTVDHRGHIIDQGR
jgi:hypothetical protein